jgi:hypothetical protein
LRCAGAETATAAFPFAVFLFLLTRFSSRPVQALYAGLAAGAAGALVMHLHCANGTWQHLLVGHVLPVLMLGGLSAVIRPLLPSRSYAP